MGELRVTRWRRYGNDRLYVKTAEGIDIGWFDVLSGNSSLQSPEQGEAFRRAVELYCSEHGLKQLAYTSSAVGQALPASVAEEASEWLAANTPAPEVEPWAVRIDWQDTARNRPGERAAQQAEKLRSEAPVRTFVARVLGVHTDERAWRVGAAGERLVAAELAKLDARWQVLHAVEVGKNGSDIDHLVIGPGGVFTINAKHHPGAKVWVGGNTMLVNGHRQPYVRNARHESSRASRLLSAAVGFEVDVRGIVAVVGADDLRIKAQPEDVAVVARRRLRRWLLNFRSDLGPDAVDTILRAARRSTTWTTT